MLILLKNLSVYFNKKMHYIDDQSIGDSLAMSFAHLSVQ